MFYEKKTISEDSGGKTSCHLKHGLEAKKKKHRPSNESNQPIEFDRCDFEL